MWFMGSHYSMPKKLYNKLVRDNIPEIMRAQGEEPETRILDEGEYKKLIRLKLLEEAGETRVAGSKEELTKELSDVMEVLEAIAAAEGISMDDVLALKAKRRAERGGFLKRIYLVSSETK